MLGNHVSPELRRAVLRYLSERLEASIISTAEAAHTVRNQMPVHAAVVTDRQLADLIAETAVEAGFDISFDGTGTIQ